VENVFLGAEPTRFRIVRWGDARRRAVSTLRELGLDADPDRVVGAMGVADQQLVEIAKAVVGEFGVLIMDEPTAALGPAETKQVGDLTLSLKQEGIGIFLISHDVHDVFDLADRIYVMKNGRLVGSARVSDVTKDEVLGMIILGKCPPGGLPGPGAAPRER